MLRLTLVRHAQAQPAALDEEDWNRPLEASGERDARTMGARLLSAGPAPGRILSSPAVRAIKTASLLARELHVPTRLVQQEERLYLADARTLLAVVQELGGDTPHLLLVGHNPGLTEFADALSSERSVDNLPTSATYSLEFDIPEWPALEWASGVNAEFDYPKRSG
jgi:phosphohistidine phosphatase